MRSCPKRELNGPARLGEEAGVSRRPSETGSVYRPTYRSADGARRESRLWWICLHIGRPAPQRAYVPEEKTERYWKQRLFQSRERIRTAYDACTSQYRNGGIGDYGNTQYAAVRGSLVSAISAQEQLEEEARQGGIAPGWVRFD